MSARALTPEILDLLEPSDSRALCSRRDLARINAVMRQDKIMADALTGLWVPKLLADLGSGDGRFLLRVARRLAKCWPGVQAVIADRHDIVSRETRAGFAALGWHCEVLTGDIFEILPQIQPDIITANLFLHHLNDAALAQLLTRVATVSKAFVACEPHRGSLALLGARLVGALGANDVTRHDSVVSVRAGFRDQDLLTLWPQDGSWHLCERMAFPFTHVFQAYAL